MEDLPIPLMCYPPDEPEPGLEFHNVYDFIVFSADEAPATWGADASVLVSWWTDDDGDGVGVGLGLNNSDDKNASVGMTPDEAEHVAKLLMRGAYLARSHEAALEAGPPNA